MKKIIAAIPVKNEKKSIGSVVLLCRKHVDEVVVVDDGSTDKSGLIAKIAGAHVITHDKNLGKGAAIISAIKWCKDRDADIIVFLDGDGQHDPDAIPDLVDPIKRGEVDITIGSRWVHEEGRSEMPFHRILGNWVLSTATSFTLNSMIRDSQSGYRAFHFRSIPAFMQSTEKGFAAESEMITLADKKGLRWKEVGIKANYHQLDTSTQSSWYHGISVLGQVLKVLRVHKPVRFFGALSMLSFLMATGIAVWGRLSFPDSKLLPLGALYLVSFFTIMGGFLMFSGIMLSGMNRVSERIFKHFYEVYSRR